MTIGMLRAGVAPDRVLPTATDAAAGLAVVEGSRVDVVRGRPRLTVRFTADDDELAEQIAEHVVGVTDRVAEAGSWTITRRVHGEWRTV